MCEFRGHKYKQFREDGLLPDEGSFPIPIREDFGGDVLIGWRAWNIAKRKLSSPYMRIGWDAGKVMGGSTPSTATGRGVYAWENTEEGKRRVVNSWACWGLVALWGKALTFDPASAGRPGGMMGQFAFPLEVFVPSYRKGALSTGAYERYGVKFHYV